MAVGKALRLALTPRISAEGTINRSKSVSFLSQSETTQFGRQSARLAYFWFFDEAGDALLLTNAIRIDLAGGGGELSVPQPLLDQAERDASHEVRRP